MGQDYDNYRGQKKRARFVEHSDEEDSYDPQERLILQRNNSLFSNKGFLFLAAVSCIVCSYSFTDTSGTPAGMPGTVIINTGKNMLSTKLDQLNQMGTESSLSASNVGDYQLSDEEILNRQHQKMQNTGT